MKRVLAIGLMAILMIAALAGCASAAPKGNGKSAIMVVSFGTSYADTRALTIEAIENRVKEEYPDYEVVRAFTSDTIIDILRDRDGIEVFTVQEAFDHLKGEKYSNVYVQPLHIINGAEYDDVVAAAELNAENFESVQVGSPLLTSVEDFKVVVESLRADIGELAENEAVVFMGHGTHHYSNAAYPALEYTFHDLGMDQVHVGTVEGYPEIGEVKQRLIEGGYEKVTLMPFMLVAGDHAENDMAGDEEESWKMILKGEGYDVETYMHGLGENEGVQNLFLQHLHNLITGDVHE